MTTKNTFGIVFFLKKYKVKKGKAPIYARITVDGKRVDFSLKKDIDIDNNWNFEKGMAKSKNDETRKLNTYLEQIRSGIVECYQQLQLRKCIITAEAVKKLYLGEEEKGHSLISVFEYHNSEMKRELEPGTQKNYGTTKRYIESFLKRKHHTSDIYLTQLNYKFLNDFIKFVKENPLDSKKPCTQNGTMKHVERLRKVVNMSIKNEWLDKDPFLKFSPHFVKKERGFLLLEELEAIENKVFTIERLKLVRDLFIFSCFTGLAYADAMKLVPHDVRLGIDGKYWLFSVRKKNKNKTEEQVKIPLLPKALAIIEKYKNNPIVLSSGFLLPRLSNQKTNAYLKEIADVCKIDKDLTFHMARHTFATTVTLTNGVPMETVSKVLGHKSIRTTQIYAKVIEKKVSEDMDALCSKLNHQSKKIINSNAG